MCHDATFRLLADPDVVRRPQVWDVWDGTLTVHLPHSLKLVLQVVAPLRAEVNAINVKDRPAGHQSSLWIDSLSGSGVAATEVCTASGSSLRGVQHFRRQQEGCHTSRRSGETMASDAEANPTCQTRRSLPLPRALHLLGMLQPCPLCRGMGGSLHEFVAVRTADHEPAGQYMSPVTCYRIRLQHSSPPTHCNLPVSNLRFKVEWLASPRHVQTTPVLERLTR